MIVLYLRAFFRVVTGARLKVESNTIYIQIEEGKLLANGSIDRNTVAWQPERIDHLTSRKIPISWDAMREIDLTAKIMPTNHVITGFQFHNISSTRISLALYSSHFDFRTGELKKDKDNILQKIQYPSLGQ